MFLLLALMVSRQPFHHYHGHEMTLRSNNDVIADFGFPGPVPQVFLNSAYESHFSILKQLWSADNQLIIDIDCDTADAYYPQITQYN